MDADAKNSRRSQVVAALVGAVAAGVFWRTAYPTITWWDSSSYSLAAATLGVNSPPGSLLLTLIGWPVARLSFGLSPAHALNLFAGLLAAVTSALVYAGALASLRIAGFEGRANTATALGAAGGALTFAFTGTLWTYAIQFTPYVLTAAFTGLILWTMLRWWSDADRPNGWRWLALLGLLFGLDFSVHRTNALLIPGAVVWILLRRPTTWRSPTAILAGAGALTAGLVVQLLLIPIAAFTDSTLNFSDPSSLSRFWDYVTIKQLGGSFLLQLFPRKAPIWSAQTMDVLRVLGHDFLNLAGHAGALGLLPAVAAACGIVALWRGNRRFAAALASVLVLQVAFTVLYFNIPADFFRTFDRHYLPIGVTLGVLAACGLGAAMERAAARPARIALAASAAALLPATQLWNNWTAHDASRRFFTRDYAANALLGLPPNAIYFTVGDNDTFPVMYLQSVEGVRPDVTIINLSVANIPRWPDQLTKRDPMFPISLSPEQRSALVKRPWRGTDTIAVLPIHGTAEQFGMTPGVPLPDSLTLRIRPASGDYMLPAEIVLLDIVRTNAWKRPLTFAITGPGAMEWLTPYGRIEGLYSRVVPMVNAPADPHTLRAHLFDVARYRGFADPSVAVDGVSRTMGMQAYGPLMTLLSVDAAAGALAACRADRGALLAHLPFDRLTAPPEYRERIESACGDPVKY
jgi:hypothetical protein